ncbi:MAG: hypothetical protein IIB41_06915, partial [Candidatus Marinimicrobia bacterium]|nr:hypothetical protein [Candidatus Neomarinimicrobiota bacterium]
INLDHFLATDIERAQSHLTVPGMANSVSPIYAKNAETAIAENRNRFTHRMPEKWKRYGF